MNYGTYITSKKGAAKPDVTCAGIDVPATETACVGCLWKPENETKR